MAHCGAKPDDSRASFGFVFRYSGDGVAATLAGMESRRHLSNISHNEASLREAANMSKLVKMTPMKWGIKRRARRVMAATSCIFSIIAWPIARWRMFVVGAAKRAPDERMAAFCF